MDKSSINSLNSKRDLKLPPIQGAVPAAIYRDRSLTNNKPVSLHNGPVRIKKQAHQGPTFHSLNDGADFRTRVGHFPRKPEINSQRQHATIELNLGHDFPKSYSVLPPISKLTSVRSQHSDAFSCRKSSIVKRETRRVPEPKKTGIASERLSERRRERREKEREESVQNTRVTAEKEDESIQSRTEQEMEIKSRKRSSTSLLYSKCKRKDRRGGVCPENEESLINVTDQLKEIFLRRNMEEMYLI